MSVDVGGGKGHFLTATLQMYPSLPRARCILEYRDEIIKAVEAVNYSVLSAVLEIESRLYRLAASQR